MLLFSVLLWVLWGFKKQQKQLATIGCKLFFKTKNKKNYHKQNLINKMDNPLVTPDLGLIVWTTVVFCILLFLLAKFAWRPILNAVKQREQSIEEALNKAEEAKKEMAQLQSANEDLLKEARAERDEMLKEARTLKDKIIAEAKAKAGEDADRIIASARESIQHEKMAAVTELKNQVAVLSIEIAEKILKQELSSEAKQSSMISSVVDDIQLN